MFIKYSTSHIPPKKSKGKGLQRKKTTDDSQETVNVSEESEHEPESVKRKTSSKRRVKKKVTLPVDDNIISDDPDTALELGKSISQTKAKEAEATRQVHATHARIVTEFIPKPTKRIKSGKVTSNPPKKLKGAPSPEEQEAANIMQALKESKKTSKRQSGTRGSSEGIGTIPGFPSEPHLSLLPQVKELKDKKEGDADDEADETKSDEDDIYKYKIHVRKDDEEMLNAKVDNSDKGDQEVTDAAKADAEKTSEVKDDPKKIKLPRLSIAKLEKDVSDLKKIDSLLKLLLLSRHKFHLYPTNHRLYHALMEALIEDENAMDKGVADIGKQTKRRRTKDSESSKKPSTTKETPKGKAPSKGSKTGKFASAKEPVKEPITEVVIDDVSDDVVHYDDQPQDASERKTTKTSNPYWFKQPPRPPSLDPE
ncbi:hypothetical protein Tco_0351705 [Tanacetum coccineum]